HRLIFDSAPDGLLTVDAEGIIRMVNAQTEQMFGYSASELVGRSSGILVPSTVRASHVEQRQAFFHHPDVRRMGAARWLEGRRKDGTHITFQVTLTPLVVQDSTHVMAFVTDMTRARQLEVERDRIVQKMMESQ